MEGSFPADKARKELPNYAELSQVLDSTNPFTSGHLVEIPAMNSA